MAVKGVENLPAKLGKWGLDIDQENWKDLTVPIPGKLAPISHVGGGVSATRLYGGRGGGICQCTTQVWQILRPCQWQEAAGVTTDAREGFKCYRFNSASRKFSLHWHRAGVGVGCVGQRMREIVWRSRSQGTRVTLRPWLHEKTDGGTRIS